MRLLIALRSILAAGQQSLPLIVRIVELTEGVSDLQSPEVVGIALLLLALLSLGSILSYDSTDPVYFFKAEVGNPGSSNWVGRVGATMAEALLQMLGTVAFLFPLGIAALGWRRLKGKTEEGSGATLVGYALLALALCTLLDLLFGNIRFRDQIFPSGGIIGHLTGAGLVHLFNFSAAVLVTVALLTAVVALFTSRPSTRLTG